MQKNNMVLMAIIALILFLPSSSVKSDIPKTWLDKIDKYELMTNEGLAAFHANETPLIVIDTKVDNVVKCECQGTGKIRTGDNRILPCPCGNNCTCSKTSNIIELTIESSEKKNTDSISEKEIVKDVDYIQSLEARCILFTNSEWCVPCAKLKNSTLKELKKAGYKIGTDKESFTHIAILDENHPMFAKYGHESIPLFLFVKNGKVVKELRGYQTSRVIADEINRNLKDE